MQINTALLEQLLSKYFDAPVVANFKVMGKGQENTSVKLTLTTGETYILRVWGDTHGTMGTRKQSDIEGELEFMIRARRAGVPVPRIYLSKTDQRSENLLSGNDYVVMDYVPGELPSHATAGMIQQIAEAMAHLHILAETFRYPAPRSWPGTIIDMTNERLQKLPGLNIPSDLRDFIQPIQTVYETALQTADLQALPRGPIHGDIMWENLKFHDGTLQGIFDFDDCRDSYFLEDITKALVFDLNDSEHSFLGENGENVQTFLAAYSAIRPLTEEEKQLLPLFFTASYLYRMIRYMSKLVDGKRVYWPRLPALIKRYEQNRSFFLPTDS
jgi:homoserine kinase type II